MSWADLYPISTYIIFSRSALYHIVFSPVIERLEFSFLEVKYDIFRYGDEGTWHKEAFTVEEYKHTHTHTHTTTLNLFVINVFVSSVEFF